MTANSPAVEVRPTVTRGGDAPARSPRAVCPFCSLLCDDLVRGDDGAIGPLDGAVCGKASNGFARPSGSPEPQIAGRPVDLPEAIVAAAAILQSARLPLFGGLATDVDGMRGLLALADRTGGVVDHAGSRGAFRNMAVLQSRGWVMSTLTEVRNRADLVVVVGDGIGASFPRFYQRVVGAAETMFGSLSRRIVFIGSGADRTLVDPGVTSETIACLPDQLGSAIGSLRAALRGRPVPGATGVNPEAIAALAQRIQAARYPVVVWAPLPLPETDGDLIVLSIADLVRDLNVGGRAAGLSLGGNDGGATAQAVTAWQTGYPLRVSLATGKPIYDPVRFDIARMLPAGEGDALIWTAAISAELGPPATTIPTIVLGTPGLTLARTPEVFIPVGTPGLDHAGDLIRTDSVVSLQLRGWRNVGLPTVADIALRIAAHVTDRPES